MSRESVPVAGSDWGSRTASITWTTPLHDSMSAVTTVAEPLSTTFPPLTARPTPVTVGTESWAVELCCRLSIGGERGE